MYLGCELSLLDEDNEDDKDDYVCEENTDRIATMRTNDSMKYKRQCVK